MQFDPDKYLAKKQAFNPDDYLASKGMVNGVDYSITTPYIGGDVGTSMQDTRPDAQLHRPETPREAFQRGFSKPISSLRPNDPLSPYLDAFISPLTQAIPSGAAKIAEGLGLNGYGFKRQAPDIGTGIGEVGQGLVQSGIATAFPLASAFIATGEHGLNQVSPTAGKVIGAITNPVTSSTSPKTRAGQAYAGLADAGLQYGALKGAEKLVPIVRQRAGEYMAERSGANAQENILKLYPPPDAPSKASLAVKYRESIPTVSKYMASEIKQNGIPSKDIGGFEQVVNNVKNKIWEQADVTNKPYATATVDASSAVDDVMNGLDPTFKKLHPDEVQKIEDALSRYRQPITMTDAQSELARLNAEQKPVYDKNGNIVSAMLKTKTILDAENKFADALREKMFDTAESYGDKSIQPLRKDYGAVKGLSDEVSSMREKQMEANKQPVWSGYNNPIKRGFYAGVVSHLAGLNPAMAGAVDAAVTGAGIISKFRNRPNALANRTMNQLKNSNLSAPQYQQYTPPNVRGLLPTPTTRIAPEYQSQSQGYPNSAPQMADMASIKRGEYPMNENAIRDIVAQGGAKYIGIQDFGKMGKFILFNEPSGGTLALRPEELTPENVAKKVAGFKKK